jgi:hypothetical protein
MTRKPRILIVGAQHGDERLGPRVQRLLKKDTTGRYATVDYLCGNPRAYRQNVRFIETDLNRSYDTVPPQSYEQKRAQKILQHIREHKYDYVLDVHTSRAQGDRFFLATHVDGAVARIVGASPFTRVAVMPPAVADCSLIGHVPQAISVEYDRPLARTKRALDEIIELLDNLLAGRSEARPRELFYVADKIPLDSTIHPNAKNFELCAEGFYPVIYARGGSYKQYLGFAAPKKEVVTL